MREASGIVAEWGSPTPEEASDAGGSPSVPALLSLSCVLFGLFLAMKDSIPVNLVGYALSTLFALTLNAQYWRRDMQARRDYAYRPSTMLRALAGISVVLALVAAGLNIWKIAFFLATR